MKCRQIQERISKGESLSPPAVREHLEGCESCRALADEVSGTESDPMGLAELGAEEVAAFDPDAMSELVARDIASEAGWSGRLRSLSTATRRFVGLGVIATLVSLTFIFNCRADWGVYPTGRLILEVAFLIGINLSVLWLFLHPLHAQERAKKWVLGALVIALVFPFVLGLLPQAHVAHPESLLGVGDDFVERAAQCLIWGLAVSGLLVILLMGLDRAAQREEGRIWLVAAAAGCAAVLALQLKCPLTYPGHILAGHGPVVVLAAVMFWVMAWKVRR